MSNIVTVRGRDELAAAIENCPLDVDTVIYLERKAGRTRYSFPAVCYPDGSEVRPHGEKAVVKGKGVVWVPQFISAEQHAAWQRKRRQQIAKTVRAKGRKWFE